MNKKFLLKKLKNWKRSLLTYLEKRNSRKLSEVFRFCTTKGLKKSHKRFKEEDAMKNACDGVATALEFIKTRNYFYFNSFISFFETVLFIWLSPLVPGVPNFYPQYYLIVSFTIQKQSFSSQIFFNIVAVLKISQYSQESTCVGVSFK